MDLQNDLYEALIQGTRLVKDQATFITQQNDTIERQMTHIERLAAELRSTYHGLVAGNTEQVIERLRDLFES
jgi:hypothetical protein